MYQYEAKVKKILKGDMIDAEVDLGFRKKQNTRFRLWGISLVSEAAEIKLSEYILEKTVMIQSIKNSRTKTKGDPLWLCIIYLPDDIHSVNDRMVNQGYAKRVLE